MHKRELTYKGRYDRSYYITESVQHLLDLAYSRELYQDLLSRIFKSLAKDTLGEQLEGSLGLTLGKENFTVVFTPSGRERLRVRYIQAPVAKVDLEKRSLLLLCLSKPSYIHDKVHPFLTELFTKLGFEMVEDRVLKIMKGSFSGTS